MVTCRLTACTPGSAPGPTLGVEYGKPLPLPFNGGLKLTAKARDSGNYQSLGRIFFIAVHFQM